MGTYGMNQRKNIQENRKEIIIKQIAINRLKSLFKPGFLNWKLILKENYLAKQTNTLWQVNLGNILTFLDHPVNPMR